MNTRILRTAGAAQCSMPVRLAQTYQFRISKPTLLTPFKAVSTSTIFCLKGLSDHLTYYHPRLGSVLCETVLPAAPRCTHLHKHVGFGSCPTTSCSAGRAAVLQHVRRSWAATPRTPKPELQLTQLLLLYCTAVFPGVRSRGAALVEREPACTGSENY